MEQKINNVFCTRRLNRGSYEKAMQHGIKITDKRFIQITPILSKPLRDRMLKQLNHPGRSLIFTSRNAVHLAFGNYLRYVPEEIRNSWRFYSLSGATRKALLRYFSTEQIVGDADYAAILAQQVVSSKDNDLLHFFCGNRRRNTLPDKLNERHIPFKEWVIYKTSTTPHRVRDGYKAYLFYSPSAIESFFSVNTINPCKPCFVIGRTTAAALRMRVRNPIITSKKPDTSHLLASLYHYFETKNEHVKK